LFPPAAPLFTTIGVAADGYKFSITGDKTQLAVDVVIPLAIGRTPVTGYVADIAKEASGQALKALGSEAYQLQKSNEKPR
jgi:hypothetical protein